MNGWIWGIAAVGVGAGVYYVAAKKHKPSTSQQPKSGTKTCNAAWFCNDGNTYPGCDAEKACADHGGPLPVEKIPLAMAGKLHTGADPISKWEPQPPTDLPTTIDPNPTPTPTPATPSPLPIASPDQLANLLRRLPVIADRI